MVITKGQAQSLAAGFNQSFWDRCLTQLDSAARSGVIGSTIAYGITGPGSVSAAVIVLQNLGWTVTRDDPNSVLIVT